jgi:hypothetical protein
MTDKPYQYRTAIWNTSEYSYRKTLNGVLSASKLMLAHLDKEAQPWHRVPVAVIKSRKCQYTSKWDYVVDRTGGFRPESRYLQALRLVDAERHQFVNKWDRKITLANLLRDGHIEFPRKLYGISNIAAKYVRAGVLYRVDHPDYRYEITPEALETVSAAQQLGLLRSKNPT